jgi:RNA recognition motif-containing protein
MELDLKRKTMRIHIINLEVNVVETDLQRLFSKYGEVERVELIRDRWNNRSHGRAVVVMPVQKEGVLAIDSINGQVFRGKRVSVSEVTYDPAPHSSWARSRD